jgi:glycosyltransferase involved in cell wall biosynthesis
VRILLLNQFVPPSSPPTAKLLGDLAAALEAAGHEVRCIGASSGYGAVRGVRRLLRDLGANLSIGWRCLTAGRCDWIVCFSDPPGLPATARAVAALKGAALAHWAMDVYPQTAVALRAVRPGVVTKLVAAAMHFGYRGCRILVALDADMKSEIAAFSRRPVAVLAPWPPAVAAPGPEGGKDAQYNIWLYSGNLGRAHDFETMLRAQKILEDRDSGWRLRIQGGGPAREAAQRLAAELGLKHCQWDSYVDEADLLTSLLQADALVATQKPETRGLLWPSKLALMRHVGLPIAWVGPAEGAVADWLRKESAGCGIFAPGQEEALAVWLQSLPKARRAESGDRIVEKVHAERRCGMQWWMERLQSKSHNG